MTSPLRVVLRHRLTTAMRARDRQTTGAMRNVLAALENAEAVPVASGETPTVASAHIAGASTGLGAGDVGRRVLSRDDERAVVEGEIAELRASSAALAAAGQRERGDELLRAAEIVEEALREGGAGPLS